MRKKGIIMLLLGTLISTSCLVASEQYAYKAQHQSQQSYKKQDQLGFLKGKIDQEQIEWIEVGVELCGIVYDEKLQDADMDYKKQQMENVLVGYSYTFYVKNQKDIHYNTYYNLKIVGNSDVTSMDQLRNKGYAQLKAWYVTPKETIYFKGILSGSLSQEENLKIKDRLFESLEVKPTNSYQDDLIETTCAYYGYTPYIKDTIVEADGQKSNVQVGFKYDELQDQTELIVAFPFYNEPF